MQKEILLVAEAVSGEKGLPQEAIFRLLNRLWQLLQRKDMLKTQT